MLLVSCELFAGVRRFSTVMRRIHFALFSEGYILITCCCVKRFSNLLNWLHILLSCFFMMYISIICLVIPWGFMFMGPCIAILCH